ncbi:hypothetical protein MTX78_25075 (plasmid) [Hymenobacter tibetensis]|uniref:Uncharacterized protein n=1 Tax=Hymenobacter tibetensis TaxID=497967 RepID=A0ABY4D6K7_9BACT|nr:hypothetical protein [Hymenobacter tibetensis]UOG77682.1 hypothetical protein MTX78_25075 [Hymenobacter tibetensis]
MRSAALPATISLECFRAWPLPQQAALLFAEGTLLAYRWETHRAVGLYQLANFFCELSYDTTTYALRETRAFTHLTDFV